jgi:protein tyrosine phosphatase (PTP) superfamily phosphohydrolase (DUF442 family)
MAEAEARYTGDLRWRSPVLRLLRPRRLLLSSMVVLTILLGLEAFRVIAGDNVHTVIPGKVYRSAQPSAAMLTELAHDHGLKTVINLRGLCPNLGWYATEAQSTHDLGLNQEDICLSAYRLPSSTELRHLIEVLDRSEYPILIHCRRGSDRTGLVSAAVLLLQEGVSLSQARGQLSWRYGHIAAGRVAHLSDFYNYYAAWLAEQRLPHSPGAFRHWATREYQGGACCAVFENWFLSTAPTRAGQPFTLTVHVRNGGHQAWRLSPMPLAGAHLKYNLFKADGTLVAEGKCGFQEARVAPGQGLDLTVPVAAAPWPGEYRLVLDLFDEQMGYFYQMGSEPLELRLDVRE